MEDVRAKRNQRQSRGEGNVSKDLKQVAEHSLLGNIGRAHEFESDPCLEIVAIRARSTRQNWDAHLTIYGIRHIKADYVHDHGQKGCHARQGVYLQQVDISVRVAAQKPFLATYPYRPPVGATLLDDAPFVIKGSEKFPAGMEGEAR
jgi:hypothetical protein